MQSRKDNSSPSDTPQRLRNHECYLGLEEWLLTLFDHYPQPVVTDFTAIGYRVALEGLSLSEIDIAFRETFRRHHKDFRPTSGEILGYLHESRVEQHSKELRALPEPTMSPEEMHESLQAVRKEISWLSEKRSFGGAPYVIELSEEELARRKQDLKLKALDWWESQGKSA